MVAGYKGKVISFKQIKTKQTSMKFSLSINYNTFLSVLESFMTKLSKIQKVFSEKIKL